MKRRYKQFESFRHNLKAFCKNNPEVTQYGDIPKLPGDTFGSFYIPGYRFRPDFVKERASGLQVFLSNVVKHANLLFCEETIKFLTNEDYALVEKPFTVGLGY